MQKHVPFVVVGNDGIDLERTLLHWKAVGIPAAEIESLLDRIVINAPLKNQKQEVSA